MFSRASAIAAAGIVLSQPTRQTSASNMWPRVHSSIESAITSREISDVFMPSVPIVMPSLMAMVLNSIGVPPALRTPSATFAASRRRLKLHGMVPIQVFAMPMIGFCEVFLGEADAVVIRARGGARRPVGDRARVVLGVECHVVLRVGQITSRAMRDSGTRMERTRRLLGAACNALARLAHRWRS